MSSARLSKMKNLPGADNLPLGTVGDADIGVRGELVRHESTATSQGNSNDNNDGISTRVTEPVSLELGTDQGALGAGLHSSASTDFEEEEEEGKKIESERIAEMAVQNQRLLVPTKAPSDAHPFPKGFRILTEGEQ
jgi:hypothetical protein